MAADRCPTPEQQHRRAALKLWSDERGGVRCHLDGPDCSGRLQAAHYIPRQSLRRLYGQALILTQRGEHRPILERELDEWIADGRNSLICCELHHGRFDRLGLAIDPPEQVREFAAEAGIAYLLSDDERSAA